MAKQTFTAGQVLTATQMNNLQANDYNWTTSAQTSSYVLVAANAGQTVTMTNASATTITVNTGLFTAGDTVRIINLGAGTCTITAGTATVSSAGSLALVQNQAGTLWFSSASAAIFIPDAKTVSSGLNLITSQTVGSGVSSVTVSNCFSSTYTAYKILYDGGTASAQCELLGQLSGITTGYYVGIPIVDVATNGTGSYNVNNGSTFWVGFGSTNSVIANIDIHNPFATQYKYGSINVYLKQGTNNAGNGYISCVSNTSASGIVISTSTGTMTGGTIRVYGYLNS